MAVAGWSSAMEARRAEFGEKHHRGYASIPLEDREKRSISARDAVIGGDRGLPEPRHRFDGDASWRPACDVPSLPDYALLAILWRRSHQSGDDSCSVLSKRSVIQTLVVTGAAKPQHLYITEPGGGEEAQRNIHTTLFILPGARYRVPGRRNPGIPGSKPIHNAPRRCSDPPDTGSPPCR